MDCQQFVPIKDGGEEFNMEKVLSWTSMRALLDYARLGGKYKDFVNFTLGDLLKHIGLIYCKAYLHPHRLT